MNEPLLTVVAVVLVFGSVALRRRWVSQSSMEAARWLPLPMLLGGSLSLAGLIQGAGLWLGGVNGLNVAACAFFLLVLSLTRQSNQVPAVAVGGPILDFSAQDENDREFHLADLKGKPILLKFFRGHW